MGRCRCGSRCRAYMYYSCSGVVALCTLACIIKFSTIYGGSTAVLYGRIQTNNGRQKYSAKPITLAHDEILTNGILYLKRGTLQMQIAVSRE